MTTETLATYAGLKTRLQEADHDVLGRLVEAGQKPQVALLNGRRQNS